MQGHAAFGAARYGPIAAGHQGRRLRAPTASRVRALREATQDLFKDMKGEVTHKVQDRNFIQGMASAFSDQIYDRMLGSSSEAWKSQPAGIKYLGLERAAARKAVEAYGTDTGAALRMLSKLGVPPDRAVHALATEIGGSMQGNAIANPPNKAATDIPELAALGGAEDPLGMMPPGGGAPAETGGDGAMMDEEGGGGGEFETVMGILDQHPEASDQLKMEVMSLEGSMNVADDLAEIQGMTPEDDAIIDEMVAAVGGEEVDGGLDAEPVDDLGGAVGEDVSPLAPMPTGAGDLGSADVPPPPPTEAPGMEDNILKQFRESVGCPCEKGAVEALRILRGEAEGTRPRPQNIQPPLGSKRRKAGAKRKGTSDQQR